MKFPPPLIVSLSGPGPWIVRLIMLMKSGPLVRLIVPYALLAKLMTSPETALLIASLQRAGPTVVCVGHGHRTQKRPLFERGNARAGTSYGAVADAQTKRRLALGPAPELRGLLPDADLDPKMAMLLLLDARGANDWKTRTRKRTMMEDPRDNEMGFGETPATHPVSAVTHARDNGVWCLVPNRK